MYELTQLGSANRLLQRPPDFGLAGQRHHHLIWHQNALKPVIRHLYPLTAGPDFQYGFHKVKPPCLILWFKLWFKIILRRIALSNVLLHA